MISGQDELKTPFQFVYRDYTKIPGAQSGEFLQLDAWLEKNPNRLPFAVGQKVRITWKTSDDKTKRIAVKVTPFP
ncbi:MAG TPA: hypothetical protein VGR67_14470 [Candidatus Polarisedimenticolia bacterium]|jgi:hypothetical protein|nr:hypothetical protein [Candidatus Polarisedimenticolia bacterium]